MGNLIPLEPKTTVIFSPRSEQNEFQWLMCDALVVKITDDPTQSEGYRKKYAHKEWSGRDELVLIEVGPDFKDVELSELLSEESPFEVVIFVPDESDPKLAYDIANRLVGLHRKYRVDQAEVITARVNEIRKATVS